MGVIAVRVKPHKANRKELSTAVDSLVFGAQVFTYYYLLVNLNNAQ